ncbi:MAG: nuclear transport factor 2 family protein [Bacteroidia bacterium]
MTEPITPYLEILSCEKSLAEAMQNADLVLLDQLIHEDLVFVIPSGQTITKNADLDSYRAGTMQVFSWLLVRPTLK